MMTGVNGHTSEHRGRPRALELWVGGAWIVGSLAMVGVTVLFAGDVEGGPAHPRVAWPLVVVWLVSFGAAWLLQNRYERPRSSR